MVDSQSVYQLSAINHQLLFPSVRGADRSVADWNAVKLTREAQGAEARVGSFMVRSEAGLATVRRTSAARVAAE